MDAQDSYLESRILTADAIQLVQIMYQAAIDSAEQARECLHRGDIAGRSKAITKAYEIITELEVSLDHDAGSALSRNLLETYCYLRSRLLAANVEQSEQPLEEVARLLRIILEAWLQCRETKPVRQREVPAAGSGFQAAESANPSDRQPANVFDETQGGAGGWPGYSNSYAPSYARVNESQDYRVSVSY